MDARTETDVMTLLVSMDASLKSIDATLRSLLSQRRANAPKPVASDREMDGKHGDPVVKFTPKGWSGGEFKGLRFSLCPAKFLEMLADSFDYFAKKNDDAGNMTDRGTPKGDFDRRSAALARGWAKRVGERNGSLSGDVPAQSSEDLGSETLPPEENPVW